MTATITEVAPCRKAVRMQLGLNYLTPLRAAVVEEFQRQCSLAGFRKGKAPVELVVKQYADSIQEQTLQRATKRALEQLAKTHDLKPVGPFELTTATFHETQGLLLEATVEVEPSFAPGDYRAIPLTKESLDISEEELAQALERVRESMAQLVPAGEGQPKLRQVPAIDDELAKDMGFERLDQLREHVKAKLIEQRRAHQTRALEIALEDELLKRHPFEVPAGLVGRQTERLARDFKARLLLSGMTPEQVEHERGQLTEPLRQSAERQVKRAFLLERIADAESITVTEDELLGRVWQLAQRWKQDPAKVRHVFDAQALWPSVVSTVRAEKTLAFLLSAAVITDPAAHPDAASPTAPRRVA